MVVLIRARSFSGFAKTRRGPAGIDNVPACPYFPRLGCPNSEPTAMKVRNSLKSAKNRDRNCVVVRRRGRVYVINKRNKRFKARQG